MKVIVVNGVARSGKDTFVDYCLSELAGYSAKFSTVDFIKDLAKQCGWNGEKNAKNRKFLSDLKDLLTEWDDVPMKKLASVISRMKGWELSNKKPYYLFVFCREPKEIDRIVDKYGAITVCVRRTEAEKVSYGNHADDEAICHEYNFYIDNNEDLEHLKLAAKTFCEYIKEEEQPTDPWGRALS